MMSTFLSRSALAMLAIPALLTLGQALPAHAANWVQAPHVLVASSGVMARVEPAVIAGSHQHLAISSHSGRLAMSRAASWSGYSAVPGGGLTSNGTGSTVYNGKLYLFGVGTDHHIYENIYNGSSWTGWLFIGGTTYYAPNASVYRGQIYLFDVGTDNSQYVDIFNGSSWGGFVPFLGTGRTYTAMGSAVFLDKLHVFSVGSDYRVYDGVYDGSSWLGWQLLGYGTYNTPNASVYNSRLYLFVVGTNRQQYYAAYNGFVWSGMASLPGGYTYNAMASAVSNGVLHVFSIGTDHQVYETVFSGLSWVGWNYIGGTTYVDPNASTYYALDLFVIGTDGHFYLNTM